MSQWPAVNSNFVEVARDSSHHPAEKRGAHDVDSHLILHPRKLDPEESSDRVLNVRLQFLRERAKVVRSHELPGRFPHQFQIERMALPKGHSQFEWIPVLLGDHVAIPTILRTEATVKGLWHNSRCLNPHVLRKCAVEHVRNSLNRDRSYQIKVADLSTGMSASIGAACPYDLAIFARDLANGIFQCSLNGSPSSLCGPAAEIGSVVGDGQFDSLSRQAPARRFAHRRLGECPSSRAACNRHYGSCIAGPRCRTGATRDLRR